MHICFISSEFPLPNISYGGIGTFLLTYSKILHDNGHKVTVVGVSSIAVKTKFENVNVNYKSKSSIKGLAWYFNKKMISRAILEAHRANKIDIIESQEGGLAFLKIPRSIKKIVRMHGGHHFFHKFENNKLNWKKALLEKITFRKTDAIISTSEFVKSETLKYIDFTNKVHKTINNPILIDQFYPADESKKIKGAVVFAGTICEKKGIRQLCLAIPKIIKEFPELHLYIYGRDWFFPNGTLYKSWMLEQMNDEIKSNITFKEPVPYSELPKVYEFAEICVFPSHIEVQGLVAPEAMCMKKNVVFTEIGPGPETIDDNINGFLCNPLDIDSIADTIIKVFQLREKHKEIGENARKKVIQKFSPNIIYEENLEFYKSIL